MPRSTRKPICKGCSKSPPEVTIRVESSGRPRGYCNGCERARRGLRASTPSWQRVLGLFDWHVPYHDRAAWNAVLEWIRENKPDFIIIGGDHGDWNSVSTHGPSFDTRFSDEAATVEQSISELQEAAPDATIKYLQGNHESMLDRTVDEKYPSLSGSVSIQGQLELDDKGIEWVPEYEQPIRIGKLHIIHGHQEMRSNSVPKYPANKFEKYVPAAGDVLWFGHVHKFGKLSIPRYGGHASIYSSGCGRIIRKSHGANRWLHGEESGWQNGVLIGHVWANGRVTTTEVEILNGQFEWGGRLYGKRGVDNASDSE